MAKVPAPNPNAKKMIEVKIDTAYLDFSYVSLDSVIDDLTEVRTRYLAEGFTDLNIQPVDDCGCYGSCSCKPRPVLYGKRLETDAEHEARRLKEVEWEAQRLARDRADYERLSKQFGGVKP